MTRKGLFWLLEGGISYTAGCCFFIAEKLFWHAIFHCFIMGATFCHVMAIGTYTEKGSEIALKKRGRSFKNLGGDRKGDRYGAEKMYREFSPRKALNL
jgi:hypothetical protein